jgi:hypothetical protein
LAPAWPGSGFGLSALGGRSSLSVKAANDTGAHFTLLRQISKVRKLGAFFILGTKNMRRLIVLAIACAVPGVSFAQSTTPVPAAEAPAKEKKICRREESTGSIMAQRICHTKGEWVQIDAANQKSADQFSNARRNSSGGMSPGN